MKLFKPYNDHIQVRPIVHETFIASEGSNKYEEIGEVLAVAAGINNIVIGDTVYFDSWTCAKYPTAIEDEFYWLVPLSEIRAIEHEISEQPM